MKSLKVKSIFGVVGIILVGLLVNAQLGRSPITVVESSDEPDQSRSMIADTSLENSNESKAPADIVAALQENKGDDATASVEAVAQDTPSTFDFDEVYADINRTYAKSIFGDSIKSLGLSQEKEEAVYKEIEKHQQKFVDLGMKIMDPSASAESLFDRQEEIYENRKDSLSKILDPEQVHVVLKSEKQAIKKQLRSQSRDALHGLGIDDDAAEAAARVISKVELNGLKENGIDGGRLTKEGWSSILKAVSSDGSIDSIGSQLESIRKLDQKVLNELEDQGVLSGEALEKYALARREKTDKEQKTAANMVDAFR